MPNSECQKPPKGTVEQLEMPVQEREPTEAINSWRLPRNRRWTKKPEHSNSHLAAVIPQTQIVNYTSPKETFKHPNKYTARKKSCKIEGDHLEYAYNAPPAYTKRNPFGRREDTVSCVVMSMANNSCRVVHPPMQPGT